MVDCTKNPSAKGKARNAEAWGNTMSWIMDCSRQSRGGHRIPKVEVVIAQEVAHPLLRSPLQDYYTARSKSHTQLINLAPMTAPRGCRPRLADSGRVAMCVCAEVGGTLDPWQSLSAPPIGCPAGSPQWWPDQLARDLPDCDRVQPQPWLVSVEALFLLDHWLLRHLLSRGRPPVSIWCYETKHLGSAAAVCEINPIRHERGFVCFNCH